MMKRLNNNTSSVLIVCTLIVLSLLCVPGILAADFHWTSSTSGSWSASLTNWATGTLGNLQAAITFPGSGDNIFIDAAGTYTVDFSGSTTAFGKIVVGGATGQATLRVTGALTANQESTVSSNGVLLLSSTTSEIKGSGNWNVAGRLNFNAGTIASRVNVTGSLSLAPNAGSTARIAASTALELSAEAKGELEGQGDVILENASKIVIGASAEFKVTASGSIKTASDSQAMIESLGTFTVNAATSITTGFASTANTTIQQGTTIFSGAVAFSGNAALMIASGASANFHSSITLSSSLGFSGSGSVLLSASANLTTTTATQISTTFVSVGSTAINAGVLAFRNAAQFSATAVVNIAAGASARFHSAVTTQTTSTLFSGNGNVYIEAGASFTCSSSTGQTSTVDAGFHSDAVTRVQSGSLVFRKSTSFGSLSTLTVESNAHAYFYGVVEFSSTVTETSSYSVSGSITIGGTGNSRWNSGAISGSGTITISSGATLHSSGSVSQRQISGTSFNVTGHLIFNSTQSDCNYVMGSNAKIKVNNGGSLQIYGGARITSSSSSSTGSVENDGSLVMESYANATASASHKTSIMVSFVNRGVTRIRGNGQSVVMSSYNQSQSTARTIISASASLSVESNAQFNIQSGYLQGSGSIHASAVVVAGICSPGESPGKLTVNGDFTVPEDGTLEMEIAGKSAGQFDQIEATGKATLKGYLQVKAIDSYSFANGDEFEIVKAQSVEGPFRQTTLSGTGSTGKLISPSFTNDMVKIKISEDTRSSASALSCGYKIFFLTSMMMITIFVL